MKKSFLSSVLKGVCTYEIGHYLKDKLLIETEIADDPVTPVKESHIPTLLAGQINKEVGLINLDLLHAGKEKVLAYLDELKMKDITFVVVDSKVEADLQLILDMTKGIHYSIGWVGSAGLANYFPQFFDIEEQHKDLEIIADDRAMLAAINSAIELAPKK